MVSLTKKRILWYVEGVFTPETIEEAIKKGYSLRDARYFDENSLLEDCEAVLGMELACKRYKAKGVKVIEPEKVEEKPRRGRKPKIENEAQY